MGAVVGLAALAASLVTGRALAPDPVQDDLGDRCRGTLPEAAARVYLERDAIRATSRTLESGAVECTIEPASIDSSRDEDARIEVVIASTTGAGASHRLAFASTDPDGSVPFGYGWTGSYGADTGVAYLGAATLLLDCAGQPGDGLMVQVDGDWDHTDRELRRQKHEQLAVLAARLATRVSREWDCGAGEAASSVGEIPESVTPLEWPERRPVGQAEGTCADVITADQAETLGVTDVDEMPAGRAIAERCVLRSADASYRLSAAYGPAAISERGSSRVGDWPLRESLDCGGAQGRAFYTGYTGDGERVPEALFDAFVLASAERHSCDTHGIPGPDDEVEPVGPEDAEALEEPDPSDQVLPAGEDTVRALLPDTRALEGTVFTESGDAHATGGSRAPACQDIPGLCQGLGAHGDIRFSDRGDRRALEFEVFVYGTPEQARAALEAAIAWYEDRPDGIGGYDYYESVGMEEYGEDGVTFQDMTTLGWTEDNEQISSSTLSFIRQGPYLGYARYTGPGITLDEIDVNAPFVHAMLSARLDQAEAGRRPTAGIQPGALD